MAYRAKDHPPMNIPALRLQHQHIAQPCLTQPEQVVAWLGGLQGQDYPGAKWSIALRLPRATEADVVQAFDAGKLVRSWPMRGTLHVVAAADLRWMLMLTSPKNLAGSASRRRAARLPHPVELRLARSDLLGHLQRQGAELCPGR